MKSKEKNLALFGAAVFFSGSRCYWHVYKKVIRKFGLLVQVNRQANLFLMAAFYFETPATSTALYAGLFCKNFGKAKV